MKFVLSNIWIQCKSYMKITFSYTNFIWTLHWSTYESNASRILGKELSYIFLYAINTMPYMKQRDLYMKCNLSIYGPHTFRVWRYSTPYKKINSPYIFNINFIPISYTKAATFIYDLCHFHVPLSYKFRIKTHKKFDIWNSSFFLICFIWIFCVWE